MTLYGVFTGINEYAYNSDENRLRGTINDATDLITRFPCDHVLLTDKQATKENIFAAWRSQLAKCKPGDRLMVGHSSHGIEEGICCFNLMPKGDGWDSNGYISYIEVAEFCKGIPLSVLADLLFDCCHCEDGLKGLGRTYGKAKIMRLAGGIIPVSTAVQPAKPSTVNENTCYWAACEPTQTSADAYIDNKPQGAFTGAFLKFAQPGRSRSDIVFYARNWLKQQGYDQHPHLYGWPENTNAAMG